MPKQMWLNNTWRPAFSVNRFFRRRKLTIGLVSALIVFATFVTKETWRDSSKEYVDTLSNAENAFLLRSDTLDLPHSAKKAIDQIFANERAMNFSTEGPPMDGDNPYGPLYGDIEIAWDVLIRADAGLQNNERLLESLRIGSGSLRDETKALRERYSYLNNAVQKESDRTLEESLAWPKAFHKDKFFELREADLRLAAFQPDLLTGINANGWKIFRAVRDEKIKIEREYRRFALVSFGLYALGWGIGLVGTMLGNQEASRDD